MVITEPVPTTIRTFVIATSWADTLAVREQKAAARHASEIVRFMMRG
jgi:hypothetical protein